MCPPGVGTLLPTLHSRLHIPQDVLATSRLRRAHPGDQSGVQPSTGLTAPLGSDTERSAAVARPRMAVLPQRTLQMLTRKCEQTPNSSPCREGS